MIIKTLFPGPFCPETNIKFSFFDQNHGITPSKKSQSGNYVKSIFHSLGGLVFKQDDHEALFLGLLILLKKKPKRKFPIFV